MTGQGRSRVDPGHIIAWFLTGSLFGGGSISAVLLVVLVDPRAGSYDSMLRVALAIGVVAGFGVVIDLVVRRRSRER